MGYQCHFCDRYESAVNPDGSIEPCLCESCRMEAENELMRRTLDRLSTMASMFGNEAYVVGPHKDPYWNQFEQLRHVADRCLKTIKEPT